MHDVVAVRGSACLKRANAEVCRAVRDFENGLQRHCDERPVAQQLYLHLPIPDAGNRKYAEAVRWGSHKGAHALCVASADVCAVDLHVWPTTGADAGDKIPSPITVPVTHERIDVIRPSRIRREVVGAGGANASVYG